MRSLSQVFLLICLLISIQQLAASDFIDRPEVQGFIDEMVSEHEFDRDSLVSIFSEVKLSQSIVEAISRPAEARPWYKYRPIFLTESRIKMGVRFLQENRESLRRAEQVYGVPVEIMVAIIGVETRYGKNAGNYKVINSLSTLAFEYPKRSKFFRSELKQFLILAREQKLDPHSVKGSYAGAMGIPQFISSSYRNFAIDFDNDGVTDIWNNPADAIGSVGNYFKQHGWKVGEAVASPARVQDDRYLALLSDGLEPHVLTSELGKFGVTADAIPATDIEVKFLEYETENGQEFWLGFKNFYVITRYNHSALYAMAVYQLSREIRARYDSLKNSQ